MITKSTNYRLQAGDLSFDFLKSGDLLQIKHHTIMINQLLSNPIDGSLNNLYLRIFENEQITAVPLLGIQSNSTLKMAEDHVKWEGKVQNIDYEVVFHLSDRAVWFWEVNVEGSGKKIDLVYGQDLGLAEEGAIRANEAYVSQYLDHAVFEDEQKGYVICTRQNQPQAEKFPYLQQGCLQKASGYSTDGFQFFGLSYKTTNRPEALSEPHLAAQNYQYEFAYSALQSEQIQLNGKQQVVFYGLYREDHPDAVTEPEFSRQIEEAWEIVCKKPREEGRIVPDVSIKPEIGQPVQSLELTSDEIDQYFPERQLEETLSGDVYSFFKPDYEHVVLKKKEEKVERPHGHILLNGYHDSDPEGTFATTCYMYGVFNSQVVVGNSNMNKMMSNARNPLNIMKTSGQRIYIERDGQYRLLSMPSLFEVGFNYARWFYKLEDDLLIITNFTKAAQPQLQLEVNSVKGRNYRYLVTNQLTMNTNEYEVPFELEQRDNVLVFRGSEGADSRSVHPDLCYQLEVNGGDMRVSDESFLADGVEAGEASLVVLELEASSSWQLTIQGSLNGMLDKGQVLDFEKEKVQYQAYFKQVMRRFRLSMQGAGEEGLEKFNALAWWYTHNMLVHFSSPHGLEQYGGAAWGTRDVCQGPAEYFLATQNYDAIRHIIRTVYSHQHKETGDWPQWFMFDAYEMQQFDSHGDVIVWPLKVVGDYLRATGDYAILKEETAYVSTQTEKTTEEKETILAHIQKAVDYIKNHLLHDTYLSSYGDGDWDDTLQPANQQLKKFMASSWTVALTYQTLKQLGDALVNVEAGTAEAMNELAENIEKDYRTYVMNREVIPGFIYMENQEEARPMLHPEDLETSIDFRLLPMQRSMISELFSLEEAEKHYELIKRHLTFPDGVRLMNKPSNYTGGVSTHFKRSEQAANFGREIGLQYVHAHIRFVEAMAKLGKSEETWQGLSIINPVKIQEVVPNAEMRQSNTYFSSSDAKFHTRYEAQEKFGRLREGAVPVKGGWRIYSSGPGIYMNQLISNVLGVRFEKGDLIIDPVLPKDLDGLEFEFELSGFPVTFVYHLEQDVKTIEVNGKQITLEQIGNRYRQGGFIIKRSDWEPMLSEDSNIIDLYL
ncbi:cellobiose phosphorylase [Halobacillus salinarum]|uniref:Cellobiose phosphorylase n=1 Tax=Halobacillus salinarum TaxID=2932257 RepID=A0ABY4EHU1_9BACI|nr:cellobiose phosphorylase [Halobacillus salinarum]UOQ43995.1 cellobiose phosphorylase [Halobacillus salinarum]